MSASSIIGMVGLGTMGLGIAQVFAQAGFNVVATDQQATARENAAARLHAALDERVKAGKLAITGRDDTLKRLTIVPDFGGFAAAALVIEAIIEKIEAKQSLFRELEQVVAEGTVLATNTSSLPVGAVASAVHQPGRVLGLHFFNPAPAMKLVELVAHAGTDPAALMLARQVTEAAGKVVIGCADRPGFIVNRCARPFYGEALAMLEEGRSASDIDAAMMQAGYRLGPFSLIDLIGADINLAATEGLSAAMHGHPRYHVFSSLKKQVAEGRLGRKSGQGFLYPGKPGAAPADAHAIVLRIESALANEAASLLGEGGLSESDIDTALKLGLNFPRGPFESARAHGAKAIRDTLAGLEAVAPSHLKGRYLPAGSGKADFH